MNDPIGRRRNLALEWLVGGLVAVGVVVLLLLFRFDEWDGPPIAMPEEAVAAAEASAVTSPSGEATTDRPADTSGYDPVMVVPEPIAEETAPAVAYASLDDAPAPSSRVVEEVIRAASPAKVMVAEYWMSMGQPPTTQKDAGLADPGDYAGRFVQRMEIRANGTIHVPVQEGRYAYFVDLVPDYNMSSGILNWACVSNHPRIRESIDYCSSTAD